MLARTLQTLMSEVRFTKVTGGGANRPRYDLTQEELHRHAADLWQRAGEAANERGCVAVLVQGSDPSSDHCRTLEAQYELAMPANWIAPYEVASQFLILLDGNFGPGHCIAHFFRISSPSPRTHVDETWTGLISVDEILEHDSTWLARCLDGLGINSLDQCISVDSNLTTILAQPNRNHYPLLAYSALGQLCTQRSVNWAFAQVNDQALASLDAAGLEVTVLTTDPSWLTSGYRLVAIQDSPHNMESLRNPNHVLATHPVPAIAAFIADQLQCPVPLVDLSEGPE